MGVRLKNKYVRGFDGKTERGALRQVFRPRPPLAGGGARPGEPIGEHTDYNEGFVLPMAIERYIVFAANRNSKRLVTAHSDATGDTADFSLRSAVVRGEPAWSNYVRGVVVGFQRRGKGVPGFDAVIDSTLPYGGGLASSAALEVAAATLIETMNHDQMDPVEKALLCQRAEHDFAGVPCGIMDQFASVLARENHALLLDCRSRTTIPVRMTDPAVTVLIINTNVRAQTRGWRVCAPAGRVLDRRPNPAGARLA